MGGNDCKVAGWAIWNCNRRESHQSKTSMGQFFGLSAPPCLQGDKSGLRQIALTFVWMFRCQPDSAFLVLKIVKNLAKTSTNKRRNRRALVPCPFRLLSPSPSSGGERSCHVPDDASGLGLVLVDFNMVIGLCDWTPNCTAPISWSHRTTSAPDHWTEPYFLAGKLKISLKVKFLLNVGMEFEASEAEAQVITRFGTLGFVHDLDADQGGYLPQAKFCKRTCL